MKLSESLGAWLRDGKVSPVESIDDNHAMSDLLLLPALLQFVPACFARNQTRKQVFISGTVGARMNDQKTLRNLWRCFNRPDRDGMRHHPSGATQPATRLWCSARRCDQPWHS